MESCQDSSLAPIMGLVMSGMVGDHGSGEWALGYTQMRSPKEWSMMCFRSCV